MSTQETIEKLLELLPQLEGHVRPAADFYGYEHSGLWLTSIGEDQTVQASDGLPLADYFYQDYDPLYESGVHKELTQALEKVAHYPEWYDAGTLMAFSDE